jgi:hypothetical protein
MVIGDWGVTGGEIRWIWDKVYKTLQIKNTKLYTFEIICQIIASVNPIFELKTRFFGRFSCANLQLLRRVALV